MRLQQFCLVFLVIFLSTAVLAYASQGSLTQSFTYTIHGDVIMSGVGLYGTGSGTLGVSGIPSGSTILKALLYWNVWGPTPPGIPTLNSQTLSAVLLGAPVIPANWTGVCWGFAPESYQYVYRADVASIVTGNGSYTISGLPTGIFGSGSNMTSGALLLVVYEKPLLPVKTIFINDGAVSLGLPSNPGAYTTTFSLLPVNTSAYQDITYLVGFGFDDPEDIFVNSGIYFNSQTYPEDPTYLVGHFSFWGSNGPAWDTQNFEFWPRGLVFGSSLLHTRNTAS